MHPLIRRTRTRRAASAAVAAAALLVTAACSSDSGGDGGGSGTDADTLVAYTGQAGDYQANFNPYSPTTIEGPGTIFEPLFYFNQARDQEPVPRLGTEFSWNDTGTELSITVREGVQWSDGEPFTAHDVVFTLEMITEHPAMNGTGYSGTAEAIDDTHLVVRFDEPAYMDGPQVLGRIWIVPEHIWGEMSDPATDTVQEPVGTGPFVLDEFKPAAFTLAANPDYWDGEPELKKVRFVALSGNQAGADALKAGTVDWQTGPVPDIHNVEKNYPGYRAITVPLNQIALLSCSSAELGCTGPQTDPAVRQAIYYAMDREQINSLAFENTASEISPGFALPGRDSAVISQNLENPTAPMTADAARSARLLEDAGWTKGGDGIYEKDGERLSLTVSVVTGWTDYITAVDVIGQQLKAAGIEIIPQQTSWNEWSDSRGMGNYQLLIDSLYQGPAPDPFYLYSYFFSTATTAEVGESANPNFARFSDPEVDAALEALKQTDPQDTAARQEHFDLIQTRIEQNMPYIPVLTGGTTSEYHAEKFSGWPTTDDLYAFPAVWARPDHSQIFINLKPAGE
ncbi:ABC transporter substrate-binding protein [Streptomyces aidingensis]|uniref:Peptide/nickel transport system substrate-binding protein n=1 Tax=Streptomyces aidingensis TaxID=910347 RepID=A0A1I1SQN6_9ACTN|nr:ABC transporter substrate-binding protein [Streptomyces aidingensis]SFD46193.1 peptide/nickel transport system substrate-binding protein [Streptomyces aidingensis]